MGSMDGKVAIVTGASSGIGAATARLLAAEGARLVVNARGPGPLQELVEELGSDVAVACPGDVREEATAAALTAAAERAFGGLDVAVNNAGATGPSAQIHDLAPEEWRDTIDANLTAGFLAARHQVPAMLRRGGGSLVFVSSFVGTTVGFPGMGAYGAAKAGLLGLARSLAVELGGADVRVNALLPGGVDTPMNLANQPGATAATREFVEGLHALGRLGTPEEIARAALFLVSDASTFVTGTALFADGGVSVRRG